MSLQENNFPLDTDTANIFLMDEYNKKHLSCMKAFVVFIIICPPIVVATCILVTVQNRIVLGIVFYFTLVHNGGIIVLFELI